MTRAFIVAFAMISVWASSNIAWARSPAASDLAGRSLNFETGTLLSLAPEKAGARLRHVTVLASSRESVAAVVTCARMARSQETYLKLAFQNRRGIELGKAKIPMNARDCLNQVRDLRENPVGTVFAIGADAPDSDGWLSVEMIR